MTGRHERAKPVEFNEADLRSAYTEVSANPTALIAKRGLELRIDYGRWGKRDTDATYRVRLYKGTGGFRERVATAYGRNLSPILVEAYAQAIAARRPA